MSCKAAADALVLDFQTAIFPGCLMLDTWSAILVDFFGSPICTAHADMTLTRSKVKVTGLLNFRKLHFTRSLSSAILVWRLIMITMRPSLQLVRTRFFELPSQ